MILPAICGNNSRCDLSGEEGAQTYELKELINYNYNEIIPVETNFKNGGAIHLINYQLKCQDCHFTGCKAEQGGGGAIFIVANNEPESQTSFTIER